MCIFSCSSQEKAREIAKVISVPPNSKIIQITKGKVYILNLSWNYRLKKARKPLQWLQKELRGRRQFCWELACQSYSCSLVDPETQVWHRPPPSQWHCLLGNHGCQGHDCVSISVTAEGQMGAGTLFPEFGLHVRGSTFVTGIGKGSQMCLLSKRNAKVYHLWLHYNSRDAHMGIT